MPDNWTILIIVFTAFIFTVFLLIWVAVICNGIFFSKIRKSKIERKEDIFSWNEKRFFRTLEKILKDKYSDKYLIFPQFRLADLFKVHVEDEDDSSYDLKIKWHVDFLIVERENLRPVLWIELNGKSHHWFAQKAADEFKKKLYDESLNCDEKLSMIVFRNNEMKYNDKEWEFFKKKLELRIDDALRKKEYPEVYPWATMQLTDE